MAKVGSGSVSRAGTHRDKTWVASAAGFTLFFFPVCQWDGLPCRIDRRCLWSAPSAIRTHVALCLLDSESLSSSSLLSSSFLEGTAAACGLPHLILPLLGVLARSLNDGAGVSATWGAMAALVGEVGLKDLVGELPLKRVAATYTRRGHNGLSTCLSRAESAPQPVNPPLLTLTSRGCPARGQGRGTGHQAGRRSRPVCSEKQGTGRQGGSHERISE